MGRLSCSVSIQIIIFAVDYHPYRRAHDAGPANTTDSDDSSNYVWLSAGLNGGGGGQ